MTELSLQANVPLLETSWIAGLRSLQQLHLGTSRDLQLMFTLKGCAGWQPAVLATQTWMVNAQIACTDILLCSVSAEQHMLSSTPHENRPTLPQPPHTSAA